MKLKPLTFCVVLVIVVYTLELWAQGYYPTPERPPVLPDVSWERGQVPDAWRGDLWHPGDYKGQYISTREGFRVTLYQPERWQNTIYIVGNSLAFDFSVDDANTLASQLQARLRGSGYRVVNAGSIGEGDAATSRHLLEIQPVRDDVVLFYGSDAPILAHTYAMRRKYADDPVLQACDSLAHVLWNLALTRAFCHAAKRALLDELEAQPLDRDYAKDVKAAYQYSRVRGVAFYNVIQPDIWLSPRGANMAYVSADPTYDEIRAAFTHLPELYVDVPTLDLSALPIEFSDLFHMTVKGNQRLADAIALALVTF